MHEAIAAQKICGDGRFTKRCNEWMEQRFHAKKVMLTTSGSSALDMAALLCGLEPGDEVILPSYTFSSTANAFVLAGARLVFVDIRPDTMNIDESRIEEAITDRTKVIVAMHYAGVACEMDTIMDIARRHHLLVVEDAAQGVMSTYKGWALGTIGDFGCFSFHETKNFSMGEGGAILINNDAYTLQAEILREKGTNRSQFFRGQVDKYTWVSFGDSYLPSELNAAFLWAQLERADEITNNRLETWNAYDRVFRDMAESGDVLSEDTRSESAREGTRSEGTRREGTRIEVPTIPEGCVHNAHMYYLKLRNLQERTAFIAKMNQRGVNCVFHYVPLHSAPAGLKYGRFDGEDRFTTRESDRLVRLPMYYNMDPADRQTVIDAAVAVLKEGCEDVTIHSR